MAKEEQGYGAVCDPRQFALPASHRPASRVIFSPSGQSNTTLLTFKPVAFCETLRHSRAKHSTTARCNVQSRAVRFCFQVCDAFVYRSLAASQSFLNSSRLTNEPTHECLNSVPPKANQSQGALPAPTRKCDHPSELKEECCPRKSAGKLLKKQGSSQRGHKHKQSLA